MWDAGEYAPVMAHSCGAASLARASGSSQQSGSSHPAISGMFPALLTLEMRCKDTKKAMGELQGMTPLWANPAIPSVLPSSLAHLTLRLLLTAPSHPFAKGERACTTPYLSHEILLKRLLPEGLSPQAVCKVQRDQPGQVWPDLPPQLPPSLPMG